MCVVICPVVLFLLDIVLSVLLRVTDSDYPISIFKLVLYIDRKTFEVMTSTYPNGTIGSVYSLLVALFNQGIPNRNHKLWNIVSTDRYVLHMLL
jgi:hypothetical protein